jgi:hypothetical protein
MWPRESESQCTMEPTSDASGGQPAHSPAGRLRHDARGYDKDQFWSTSKTPLLW